MILNCPKCDSKRIDTRHYARRTGSALGALTGAIGLATSVYRGAEIGAMAGTLTGPVGTLVGTVTGAIFGCLLGGATGGALGAKLGEVVDSNILANHRCLDCGFTFCSQSTDFVSTPFIHTATSQTAPPPSDYFAGR